MAGVARSLTKGAHPRRQTFAELRELMGAERGRRKLRRHPAYAERTAALEEPAVAATAAP